MYINSKFNVENVFVHSTTAIPICRCSFDTYFHISAGQKKKESDTFSVHQFRIYCVYLKSFVKLFLRVEGMFVNVLRAALGDPVAPLEFAGVQIGVELCSVETCAAIQS